MIQQYAHSERYRPTIPPDDSHGSAPRLLLLLPICVAIVLSVGSLAPRFFLVIKENLESNPDGWRGVIPLAAFMGIMGFLLVLICVFIAAVLGFFLQVLFAACKGPWRASLMDAGRVARAAERKEQG